MASENNLNAVFTDIANAIRDKKGSVATIKPINMADEILTIGSLKNFITIRNAQYLFYDCGSLTSEQLASILKYDDTSGANNMFYMFCSDRNLTFIPLFNSSNVNIMTAMFMGCVKLEKIDMEKLASGEYETQQFAYNCHSLKTLIIRTMDVIPTLKSDAFENCYHFYGTQNSTYNPDGLKDGRIYVPDDKVESIKTATNWSVFADIIKPLSEYTGE